MGSIPIARANKRWVCVVKSRLSDTQATTESKSSASVEAVKVPGPASDQKQLVVRRVNWKDKKERAEEQAAQAFCDLCDRNDWQLIAPSQSSTILLTSERVPQSALGRDGVEGFE